MHPIDCRADAALQNGSLRRHKICALICAFIHFPHTSLEGPDRSLTAIDSHRPTTLLLWVESRFEKAWNLYRLWILHIQEIRNVSEPCENEDSYKNFAECIRMFILLRYSPGCLVVQSASLFWATKARVSDILSLELLNTVQFCLYGRAVWNSMFRCSSDKEQLSFWTRNNCSAVTSARNKYHHHEFLSYLPCCSYGGLTPFRWEICAPISCELKPSCGEIVLGWDFKCRFLFSSFLWWMAMPKHQGLPVLVHLLTT